MTSTTEAVRAEIESELRAERDAEIERRVAERQRAEDTEAAREASAAATEKALAEDQKLLLEKQEQIVALLPQIVAAIKEGRDIRDRYDSRARRAGHLKIKFEPVEELGVRANREYELRKLLAEFQSTALWTMP